MATRISGTKVRVVKPDGSELIGIATGLDHGADLIIDDRVSVSAGDVHHLRPVSVPTDPDRGENR